PRRLARPLPLHDARPIWGWRDYTIRSFTTGRDFIPAELKAAAPVIIIAEPLAKPLFGPLDPIGRTIRAGAARFTVIGVYEMSGQDRKSTRLNSSHVKIAY